MKFPFASTLLQSFLEGTTVSIVCCLVISSMLIILTLRSIRYLYSKTSLVQCWFCSASVRVTKGSENSFTCDKCEQYNGFSSDGGYNRLIPEQYTACNEQKRFCSSAVGFTSQSDILCDSCTLKQSHLVQKLAEFQPKNERHWNSEVNEYKSYLESLFPLCEQCRMRSKAVVSDVDAKLLPSFISWWKSVGSHKSRECRVDSVSKPRLNLTSGYILPRPLYRLARFCSFLSITTVTLGPIVTALSQLHCLVSPRRNSTALNWLHQLQPKRFRPYITTHCSLLLRSMEFLSVPPLVEFWFVLLTFLLQLIFISLRCSKRFAGHQSRRANPFWLLLDVCTLIFISHLLISSISVVFFQSGIFINHKPTLFYGLLVIGFVFIPLFISVLVCLFRWISFCSADWHSQKRALKETWPRYNASGNHSSSASKSSATSVHSSHVGTFQDSNSVVSPIPEFGSRWGISSPRPLFRSPVLSWPPSSTAMSAGAAFSEAARYSSYPGTEPPRSTFTFRQYDSDRSEESLITSVSRNRFVAHSGTDVSTSSRHRRRKRHRRHPGLLRFLLSLLFGRVDTFKDVLAELSCLFNALLVGIVIYGLGRLFMLIVDIF